MHNSNSRLASITFSSDATESANRVRDGHPFDSSIILIRHTALLQAIATDKIPSIPQSVRILLLGQTESTLEDELNGLRLSDVNVLKYVVRSDRDRERLLAEERTLSTALEDVAKPMAIVFAYRQVSHQRLERQTEEARRIALRRSGARGIKARKVLLDMEDQMKQSEAKYLDAYHLSVVFLTK